MRDAPSSAAVGAASAGDAAADALVARWEAEEAEDAAFALIKSPPPKEGAVQVPKAQAVTGENCGAAATAADADADAAEKMDLESKLESKFEAAAQQSEEEVAITAEAKENASSGAANNNSSSSSDKERVTSASAETGECEGEKNTKQANAARSLLPGEIAVEISALDSRRCADGSLMSGKDFWNRNDDDIPLTELEQAELGKICQQVMNWAFVSDEDVLRIQQVKDRFSRVAVRTLERALAAMEGDGRLILESSKRSRSKEWRIDREKMVAMGVSVLPGPGEDADELARLEALYGEDDDDEGGGGGDVNEDSMCVPTPTITTNMSAKKEKTAKRKEGAGASEKTSKAKAKQSTKRKAEGADAPFFRVKDSPERVDPAVVLDKPYLGGFSPPTLVERPATPTAYQFGLTGKRVEDISLAVFACVEQQDEGDMKDMNAALVTTLRESLCVDGTSPSACSADQLDFVLKDLETRNKLMADGDTVYIVM